jgi:hypothetical protein
MKSTQSILTEAAVIVFAKLPTAALFKDQKVAFIHRRAGFAVQLESI